MKDKVVALIPAYNEESRVGSTIKGLSATGLVDRIVVVDDGSTDSTALQAEAAGAELIKLSHNFGKGKAINLALTKIINYEILLLLDADLAESAKEAKKLIEPVVSGEADMVIADFPKPSLKGGFGLAKGLAAWGIQRCSGLRVNEPLSGQRAISKSIVQHVGKFDGGFGLEVGLTIDAVRGGFRILEVPTTMSHAATARDLSGFVHRGKQFYYILKAIVRRVR